MEQDIRSNYGKSYLSKRQQELTEKVYLHEKISSQLCKKHNRRYGCEIKSIQMLSLLAVLESIFLVIYNL